jgi:negative regulator of flagellin synthesis FlgM
VSNKINGLSNRPTAVGSGASVTRTRDAATGGSSGSASSTADSSSNVHITDSASKLASLEQALRDMPAVNETRVAQLRTAIESGQYTVQPEHVADQLIQMEHTLGALSNSSASDETASQSGQ